MTAVLRTHAENSLKNITLRYKSEGVFDSPKEIESHIELIWSKLIKKQPHLHASPLFRVENVDEKEIVVTDDTTYKDIVGIRNTTNFRQYFSAGPVPHVLSMIALVYTKDNRLVLLERETGDWPKSLELPGAFIRPSLGTNLYKQAMNFLHGDMNITDANIQSHSLLGSYTYTDICEEMLIAKFTLELSSDDILGEKIRILPENYSVEDHHKFFTLPLHTPTKTVLSLLQ